MTLQTVDTLYDDAYRLDDAVVASMREWAEDHPDHPWHVEYEIPAETNGWIYYGDGGALSVTHTWGDQFPSPDEAVSVHRTPTHPHDDTPDVYHVYHYTDPDDPVDGREAIAEVEGEPYRTPLPVQRKLFWTAVCEAIEWMEQHPPGE